VNVRQEHYFAEFRRNLIEGMEYILVPNLFGNGGFICQCLVERSLALRDNFAVDPLPAITPDFVEQNLEKPGPAVCTRFEAMERFPGQKVDALDEILRFGTIAYQVSCRAVEVVQMRNGRGLEFVGIYSSAKQQGISNPLKNVRSERTSPKDSVLFPTP
jgi:hypothetical protein